MKVTNKSKLICTALLITFFTGVNYTTSGGEDDGKRRPNVIVIMTDDQGYGDLGAHGNPWIKTPHLDELHGQSVRLTNHHMGTTCAPSRAGLLTGHYSNKVGVWHTVMGRQNLKAGVPTMGELFQSAGYRTAIFGKWHLGDNYPFRPQDRGFDEVVIHGGGGVGQAPDYWGNDYFDDTYFKNGKPQKFNGYCTDVWFENAAAFIAENRGRPFFTYIALNAPHSPYHVPEKYSRLYEGTEEVPHAGFYGMITNIDENLGKLRSQLEKLNIADNTILIFLTDNGTSAGVEFHPDGTIKKGYNAGMRGKKSSNYEGGHRVPFFVHWPSGGLNGGRDLDILSTYVDVVPTLAELAGISDQRFRNTDGISLAPYLKGGVKKWPDRIVFADTQRENLLVKWKQPAVMKGKWRLQGKSELYNLTDDPGQVHNVADAHPEIVRELTGAYESWWGEISAHQHDHNAPVLGKHNRQLTLTSHDLLQEKGLPVWSQYEVRLAPQKTSPGHWIIQSEVPGLYELELRRWPRESNLNLSASAEPSVPFPGLTWPYPSGKSLSFKSVLVEVNGVRLPKESVAAGTGKVLRVNLKKGENLISAVFEGEGGERWDAYYLYLKKLTPR